MDPGFWHARWQQGQIGFHQADINRHLTQRWPGLGLAAGTRVLVPLCGKSRDMTWLHAQGHRVVGVELEAQACEAFFVEQHLSFSVESHGTAQVFRGQGQAAGIELWCADFFSLTVADLGELQAWYDRAALIALPPALRQRHARRVTQLLPSGARGLLITMDHPPGQRDGPPFAVPQAEVRALLEPAFELRLLEHEDLLALPDAPERRWGTTELWQDVWTAVRR